MTAKQLSDTTITQGIVLALIGAGLAVWAFFFFETSIATPEGDAVSNLALMQRQAMIFQAGLAALVTGGLFYTAGNVIAAIAPSSGEAEASAQPSPPSSS